MLFQMFLAHVGSIIGGIFGKPSVLSPLTDFVEECRWGDCMLSMLTIGFAVAIFEAVDSTELRFHINLEGFMSQCST